MRMITKGGHARVAVASAKGTGQAWRWGALAAALALALWATVARAATPAYTPDGWTEHDQGAFALALPPAWQAERLSHAERERLFGAGDGVQLLARDHAAASGAFVANVNVIVSALPAAADSEAVLRLGAAELLRDFTDLHIDLMKSGIDLNGRDAALIMYTAPVRLDSGAVVTVAGLQFYVLDGARLYVVTVTGPDTAEFGEVAAQIGLSFTVA